MRFYISRLNPVRFLRQRDGEPQIQYYRSEVEKTMYSTVVQTQKYIQKFAIDDNLRFQFCTVGNDVHMNFVVKLLQQDGEQYMQDVPYIERTGTFNASGVRVYEVDHKLTSSYQGTWLIQITVEYRQLKEFTLLQTHCYISEPINVQQNNCELAKFKYKGDRNRPEYMMFWEFSGAIFEYEFRAEIRHDVINSAKVNAFEDRVTSLKYVDGTPSRHFALSNYRGVGWWLVEIMSNMFATNSLVRYNEMMVTLDGDLTIEPIRDFELLRNVNFKVRENELPLSIGSQYPIIINVELQL
jgi:hypothetical protein